MSDMNSSAPLPSNPDVRVIGGGLAGLTAASLVARAGPSVVVHEKRGVIGGDARSVKREGFIFNQGAHALYRGGHAERVLTNLGIRLGGGRPPAKGKLIFDGRAEIAPAGPISLLRTRALKARDKLEVAKLLALLPRLSAAQFASTTVDEWIASSVSGDRAAQMLHALVRLGTYANQPDQLSADVAIEQLQSALGPGVLYLNGGWQTLVDQLAAMPSVHIVTGQEVSALPDAPVVIIAAGGPKLAEALLGKQFEVGPPAVTSGLDLGLSQRPDEDLVIGGDVPFYFSNHSSVAALAPEGQHHAAVAQYLAEGDDPDAAAMRAFASHAGVRDDDVVVSRRLHKMTTVSALPVAHLGGLPGRPVVTDTGHPNVFVAGDWVGPVGHLADAAMASAETAANAALALLPTRSVVA